MRPITHAGSKFRPSLPHSNTGRGTQETTQKVLKYYGTFFQHFQYTRNQKNFTQPWLLSNSGKPQAQGIHSLNHSTNIIAQLLCARRWKHIVVPVGAILTSQNSILCLWSRERGLRSAARCQVLSPWQTFDNSYLFLNLALSLYFEHTG